MEEKEVYVRKTQPDIAGCEDGDRPTGRQSSENSGKAKEADSAPEETQPLTP